MVTGTFVLAAFDEIVLPQTLNTIEQSAFSLYAGDSLVIPASVQTIRESAFFLSGIKEIYFEHTVLPTFDEGCCSLMQDVVFYFRNAAAADAFVENVHYDEILNCTKSTNYNW